MFREVQRRVADGRDARRELDAAMVILTLYALSLPLSHVLGEEAPEDVPYVNVLVHGRSDLSRHFLVSAATTLFSNRAVADALGLAKEMRDRDDEDGSGFSFRDLAADRAGVRLMRDSIGHPARLTALIERLTQPLTDDGIVPQVADLPEGMDAEAFRAAYRDVESDAYRQLVERIDARTRQCAAHRAVLAAPAD